MNTPRDASRTVDVVVRLVLLGVLWLVLTEGGMQGLAVAALLLALAVGVSMVLAPAVRWRISPLAVARFIPYFLAASLRGGSDVARRALHPARPLAPGFVEHRLTLTSAAARVFFTGTINLLPGTLSVELDTVLRVHVLDTGSFRPERLAELERRVAALFGDPVPTRIQGDTVEGAG